MNPFSGGARQWANGTRAALQFLTLLPMGQLVYEPRRMLPYFAAAGLIIGTVLGVVDLAASAFWGPAAAAALDVLCLMLITGALHLDGVADTADGLFAHHTTERALAIMKDSRVGAMGVVAVVATVLVKWAAISELGHARFACLVLVPAFARAAVALAVHRLPYGRPEGGLAHPLFDAPITAADVAGLLTVCAMALLLGGRGILLVAGFFVLVLGIVAFYRRRIGCITGDMLGAMIEWTETGLFLIAAMAVGS
ncbi:MAG: adenosylcobinamide-GDP ribazoletransferase [Pseudomonadota bacterium]